MKLKILYFIIGVFLLTTVGIKLFFYLDSLEEKREVKKQIQLP